MAPSDTAKRITLLRQRLNLSKTEFAKRAGLGQAEVTHLESGRNQASTLRVREALARGFGLSLARTNEYLDGRATFLEVAQETEDTPPTSEDLEAVIRVFPRRWCMAAIQAVRALHPNSALRRPVTPEEWQTALDACDEAIYRATMNMPLTTCRRTPIYESDVEQDERQQKEREALAKAQKP
jgi:transcriptional regulator with XRE-family HTH domain